MEFIETMVFTELVEQLLSDEEYGKLQYALSLNLESGPLIPGGGLRKVRWANPGRQRGKRSGIRIIYYAHGEEKVYMLLVYDKDKQEDLTHEQLKILRAYVKERIL